MAAAISLISALVVFRLVAAFSGDAWMNQWANFSPMAAVVLCGAIFFPRKWAVLIPLLALLITDLALNLHAGLAPFTSNTVALLVSFAIVFWIGISLRKSGGGKKLGPILLGSVAGTLIFYTITNSSVWLMSSSSVYPRTIEGWIQCMTVGTPGFPPSYLFLRNSLVGDLFFTGFFWAVLWSTTRSRHTGKLAAETVHSS